VPARDAFASPTLDDLSQLGPSTPAAVPPIDFFDKVRLGYKADAADADWGFNEVNWRNQALDEVQSALRKKGIEPVNPFGPVKQQPGETPVQAVDRQWGALFDQVQHVRAGDQGFLGDYAEVSDRASFDKFILDRRNASLAEVSRKAPDGLGAAGFIGGIGHRLIDPTNYIPVGGQIKDGLSFGQVVLRTAAREAGANVALTTVLEPAVQADAAKLGEHRGIGDVLFDIGLAGATGGVIGGTFGAAGHAVHRVNATAFDTAMTGEASANSSWDVRVARAFAEAVPPEKRTPDEQAALHAIERDAEVKSTSPFLRGPEGDDHHSQWLDTAMKAMTGDGPGTRGPVKPIAREAIAGGADVSATRMPARELVKAKIHSAEGPHGGRNLLGSNATGPYQFEPRTWVSLFKRRYPGDTRSFDQIAALREDPRLNDVLINDLIAENSAALHVHGIEESAPNLYLAHVLGSDKAIAVLSADPHARLADLLPHGYFDKNPFKPEWSAAEMRAWADKRMGGNGSFDPGSSAASPTEAAVAAPEEAPGAAPIPTGRFDVDAMFYFGGIENDRPVLDPAHFASPEEHAGAQVRFERERDAMEGYAPVATADELFSPHEHFGALRRYKGTVTADAIGEALGISPDQARRAIQSMQSLDRASPFILARARGAEPGAAPSRVMRRPPPRPKGLIEFLASRGGIHDAGGDIRAMDADVGRKFRKALINNDSGMGIDDALALAIDHDYFPELNHTRLDGGGFSDKPDAQVLLDAIDAELRGEKRLSVDEQLDAEDAARRAAAGEPDHAALDVDPLHGERLFERVGHNYEPIVDAARRRGIELPDDMLVDASDLIDGGMHPDDAIGHAALASAYRNLDALAAETGDGTYAIHPDERFADDGFAEQRGGDGSDFPADAGGGGSPRVADAAGESGARLAQLANDPARSEFGDPSGVAAEAQADSLIHDLEMAANGGALRAALDRKQRLAMRQRWLGEQEKKLGHDAAFEKLKKAELADEEPWLAPDYLLDTFRDDPEGGAGILEAIADYNALASTKYRLDEMGGESDLAGILDEINEAQKAATEMRNCLKPNGGGE
jgi:hypothetical protein